MPLRYARPIQLTLCAATYPGVLNQFDKWYASQTDLDQDLSARLMPFIESGQLDAAVRAAWPIFKTRMVDRFGISEEIDGHRLVVEVFGSDGATAGLLPAKERAKGI